MTTSIQGRSRRALAALLLVGACGLGFAAAGCGDNSGEPTGYFPEGQPSGAILLTDVQPSNAETTQVHVLALVAAPPPSDGMRFYVDVDGAGYRAASDAAIPPSTTFDSGWSFFQTVLDGYDPTAATLGVVARGARDGIESTSSILTGRNYIQRSDAVSLARRERITLLSPPDSAQISEPNFDWSPLPGATSYILQGYAASGGELGFLVHIDEATKTVTELDTGAQGIVPYNWSVTGYDAGGRAIGVSTTRMVSFVGGSLRVRGARPSL